MHYSLSAAARRTLIVLLVGVLLVWAFALWSLAGMVGGLRGFDTSQLLPALLTLVVSVAVPLVIWGMLTEYGALYSVDDTALHFESYGFALAVPWAQVATLHPGGSALEAGDRLEITNDAMGQIANPVVRWLHTRLHGRTYLPIYAGLEQRDELIAQIRQRLGEAVPETSSLPIWDGEAIYSGEINY